MKKLLSLMLLSSLSTLSTQVSAHGFHYYVDISSQVQVNDKQQFTGLKQTWLYRKEITDIMLEGWDMEGENAKTSLAEMEKNLIGDLADWGYFTELRVNNKEQKRVHSENFALKLQNGSLMLTLEQPLDKPVSLKGGTLEIDMNDPEGIGLFLHNKKDNVKLPASLKNQCRVELKKVQTIPPDDSFEHGKPVQLLSVKCK